MVYIHEIRWQKGVGDAVGEADDDVPLQLKRCTIVAENKGSESWVVQALIPVVGYSIGYR